ncbi:hypothetical protein QQS21_005484 [Conoideocrella luteorostrata]|uniref:Uncharacterized protein n=1 Tax=Conoideocrella luteorostrata TaxID=1105319 RepID=A0AAJ0CPA4_9HYPO|nr:hypothetical protein QQS21_005484 [Conoideocrella luteorostrata]
MVPSWKQQVERFCHQYFQLETILTFPDAQFLRLDEAQDEIYHRMFNEEKSGIGPPDRYRVKTLKELVSRIESSIDDWDKFAISDDIMSAFSTMMSTPLLSEVASAQRKCYVTYHLSLLNCGLQSTQDKDTFANPSITLLEHRNLLAAGGTTGLRTWEAALHMGQYLCLNPSLVRGKRVLELGAGTGYISILCVKHLKAAHAIASDGSDDVVNNLPDNLLLNGIQDFSRVRPMDIKWGHALVGTEEAQWNGGRLVDVVLGADITYDQGVIPALITTLFELFDLYPKVQVFISATERNVETYQAFLHVSRQRNLSVELLRSEVPPRSQQNGPFYNDEVAIHLCRVSKI